MRLMRKDDNLRRAIFFDLNNRLSPSLTRLIWKDSNVIVYSKDNPNSLFTICEFEEFYLHVEIHKNLMKEKIFWH